MFFFFYFLFYNFYFIIKGERPLIQWGCFIVQKYVYILYKIAYSRFLYFWYSQTEALSLSLSDRDFWFSSTILNLIFELKLSYKKIVQKSYKIEHDLSSVRRRFSYDFWGQTETEIVVKFRFKLNSNSNLKSKRRRRRKKFASLNWYLNLKNQNKLKPSWWFMILSFHFLIYIIYFIFYQSTESH